MLKLLGRANSINVQKVVWCVLELGIPFERKDIGGAFGGNDTPEYLALNPNGRVPTIIDGDVVLWESNAIVRYLSAKHGEGTLSPRDVAKRADADRLRGGAQRGTAILYPQPFDTGWRYGIDIGRHQ